METSDVSWVMFVGGRRTDACLYTVLVSSCGRTALCSKLSARRRTVRSQWIGSTSLSNRRTARGLHCLPRSWRSDPPHSPHHHHHHPTHLYAPVITASSTVIWRSRACQRSGHGQVQQSVLHRAQLGPIHTCSRRLMIIANMYSPIQW